MTNETVRIAAVADIHCTEKNRDALHVLFMQMTEKADVILLCGDLTDTGSLEEGRRLAELLRTIKVPLVGVLGNHDFESNQQDELQAVLSNAGVNMLDGHFRKIKGVGFAGVRGFGGGFDKYQLQSWGEKVMKTFVQETIEEELKLESALAHLEDVPRVVLMHYSPIRFTVEGEPPEIFPFLGSSRLESPIDRFGAKAVFHGHAHHGKPEGKTLRNIPVYNVAVPVLQKSYPDHPPFRVLEISVAATHLSPETEHHASAHS
jgi:Icc-related predicted phosphoesterase